MQIKFNYYAYLKVKSRARNMFNFNFYRSIPCRQGKKPYTSGCSMRRSTIIMANISRLFDYVLVIRLCRQSIYKAICAPPTKKVQWRKIIYESKNHHLVSRINQQPPIRVNNSRQSKICLINRIC